MTNVGVIEPEIRGLLILLLSLVCLGTWPALLRLCSLQETASSSPTVAPTPPHDERPASCCSRLINCSRLERIRNLCHVYLDYSTAYFLLSCLPFLLTLIGLEQSSDMQDRAVPLPLILVAMLGGSLLSMGNISMQWAVSVYGAPLTTVLAMQASLTVLLGTVLNYLLEPEKTPRPSLLGTGVLFFFLAIGMATRAQVVYSRSSHTRREEGDTFERVEGYRVASTTEIELPYGTRHNMPSSQTITAALDPNSSPEDNLVHVTPEATETIQLHQPSLHEVNPKQLQTVQTTDVSGGSKTSKRKTFWGVVIAAWGGLCFGFFSPCFNIALNDPFHWTNVTRTSTTSTAALARTNFWFAWSFWLASFVGNLLLLQREQRGSTMTQVLWTYLSQDTWKDRQLALLAGLVCALGNILQFQGGQIVGYATADLVQAYPVVSTVWDVLLFAEFRHVRLRSYLATLLVGMYAAYLTGVTLLAASSFAG